MSAPRSLFEPVDDGYLLPTELPRSTPDLGELPYLTIHLHREPVGEFIRVEARTWMEDRGLALAESRLWDEHGPIGRSLQSLLVDDRAPGGAP